MRKLALAALLLFSALPLAAQSNDLGLWVATANLGDSNDQDVTLGFDDARGFGASYTHYWGAHLATELGATALKSKRGVITLGGVDALELGDLRLTPITATLQWHLAPTGRFDAYVGGGAAYVLTDDLESNDLDLAGIGKVEIDDGTAWLANAGATFNVSPRFGVGVDAKYIAFHPDAGPAGDQSRLDLNPLVVSAGVRVRF